MGVGWCVDVWAWSDGGGGMGVSSVDRLHERLWHELAARHQVDPLKTVPADASLIVTSPQEAQKNLEEWRRYEARIHIGV